MAPSDSAETSRPWPSLRFCISILLQGFGHGPDRCAVGPQPLQRLLGDEADPLGAAVQLAGPGIAVLPAELGGKHHLVAEWRHGLSQQFLVRRAIGLSRIEE